MLNGARYGPKLLIYALMLFGTVVGIAYGTTLPAFADDKGRHLQVTGQPIPDPVTIHTTFQPDQAWKCDEDCGTGEIVLAGFTSNPSASEAGLLLTWSREDAGWFPRWVLRLRSETGWNPALLLEDGALVTVDAHGAVQLSAAWPQSGHKYDIMVSYSQVTGEGRLSVNDLTDNSLVYAGDFRTAKVSGAMYPLVGSIGAVGAGMKSFSQAIVDTYNAYIPVGTDWQVCGMVGTVCVGKPQFGPQQQMYFKLTVPANTYGTYKLWLQSGVARTLLATAAGTPGAVLSPLLTPLPIGKSTLVIEYEKDGRVLWTDSRSVVNGSITLSTDSVIVDYNQGMVIGKLSVQGEHLPAIPLSIKATVKKMVWNESKQVAEEQLYKVYNAVFNPVVPTREPTASTYSFTAPSEPGFYRVSIDVTSPIGVAISLQRQEMAFNIYAPGVTMRPEAPISPAYQLVWNDEFSGTQLDAQKWDYRALGPRKGGVNTRDSVSIDGQGHLVITTNRVGNEYHTGMIATMGRLETTYGYFETRIKFPTVVGHWAAFWLQSPTYGRVIGDLTKSGTEIDIFEFLGSERDTMYMNLHWDGYAADHKTTGSKYHNPGLANGYHVVGLEWTPTHYVFYVDGKEVWRSTQAVSGAPQYIILSVEVGPWAGDISGSRLPDSAIFDYVRVYQK